jgi:ubiquinone/menaquinone biosynthesis C-methylase UbiE
MKASYRTLVWDDFWKEEQYDPLWNIENPQNHSDFSWKIGLEFWAKQFAQAPGDKLLECGCGGATLSRFMARQRYQCTMIDSSVEALARARAAFDKEKTHGTFVQGDILRMGFPDCSFDVVYCGGVLEFFQNIQEPIREMVRVLRPSGILAFNIVPEKLSIQSIADIERTIAHSAQCILAGRPRDAFQRMRSIPTHYHVSRAALKDYTRACREAGMSQVNGLYTNPFPALSLPSRIGGLYMRILRRRLQTWKRFNSSYARWKKPIAITYTVVAKK